MPFLIADGTSLALPTPKPTTPWPSPTTTSALKLRFLPPLTTLVTRLMLTTVSFRSSCPASIFSRVSIIVFVSARSEDRALPPVGPGRHTRPPFLEFEPRLARRVRHRLDPAVIEEAAAI